MTLDIWKERGIPLERQGFTWRELVLEPYSKLDDDAFTRVRVILMSAVEAEQARFLHDLARSERGLRLDAARVRRVEHHQHTLVNGLHPPDQSLLETVLGHEHAEIELTAAAACREPDPYLAQVHRFGLLEDLDHLYRCAALFDRLYGADPNLVVQGYADIRPGRAAQIAHRAPEDDLRTPYDRSAAHPLSKLNAATLLALQAQARALYLHAGPSFSDPTARQLCAEIASVEEQHVTQVESILDPAETILERWLLRECAEVWCYWGCLASEENARIRQIWETLLAHELGHLHHVMDLFSRIEGRDPAEVLPASLPAPLEHSSQRDVVRAALREVELRARGEALGDLEESPETLAYRARMNARGSPSQIVAAGYTWAPGGELAPRFDAIRARAQGGEE